METTIDESDAEDIQTEAMMRLVNTAQSSGDISDLFTDAELADLGSRAIDDYEDDLKERSDWERIAKCSLEKAAQEKERAAKTFPWNEASNVNYPLITVGALQFNARSYPSIVKGDEAASVKVVGADRGEPLIGPDGAPVLAVGGIPIAMTPQGPMIMTPAGPQPLPPDAQPEPVWERRPGAKAKRALRVKEYLNTQLFYKIDGWESDTDLLLMQLPIVGCAFRKVWFDVVERKHCVKLVSALNLVAPGETRDCKTAPRLSEVLPQQYPYEILEGIRSGYYRAAAFIEGESFTGKPRTIIEQHCRYDLDGDGYPEPYVVTIDHESREVLRLVANFEMRDIKAANGRVSKITPRQFYVKYSFFPHPEGKFYDLGLGHLLEQIGSVVDTIINQTIDAGTAAVAGGGFIGSGVRLQGNNRTNVIRMAPGEWKPVNVDGRTLREAMVERTFPQPSPVLLQMLDLLLAAAQDISSVKDVLTGEAKNTGQVGTTLALIEQGLQMFTAIYKRVYRALKEEYQLLFENIGKYADEATVREYAELLDDPEADFQADFNGQDMDIRPVSDPQTVTKMQQLARANFLMSTAPMAVEAQANPAVREILKRAYEAADITDIDDILPPIQPQGPDPVKMAGAEKDMAQAEKYKVEAAAAAQDMEVQRVEKAAELFMLGQRAA